jgi:hypothetical protein
MQPLSISECITFGWETFKKRPWILIGAFLLAAVISAIPDILGPHPEIGPDGQVIPAPPSTWGLITSLASLVISFFIGLGLTNFALRAHDNITSVQISDLWYPAPFWRFLGAELLAGLIIAVGFVLLIVPGIIASLGLGFVPFVAVDRGTWPIDSLKESWRITKGHKWQLLLLGLALIALNLIGLLALVIGIFVTIPITLLAGAHAYRTLAGQAGPAP